MIVQHLVWNEKLNTKELYYHANGTVCFTKNGMFLQAGTEVRFDTYFNLFDATTWKRYADIGEVQIWVEVEGRGTVQLYTEQASIVKPSVEQELIGKQKSVVKQKRVTKQELLKKQKVIAGYALLEEEKQSAKKELSVGTKLLGSQEFCGRQRVCFTLEAGKKGFYYIAVRAKRSSLIHSGAVETTQTAKPVNLALVTCTYNRKEALQKNINLLRRTNKVKQANETKQVNEVKQANEIKQTNQENLEELPVISHLYIVDNARTICLDEIATEEDKDWLTLIPNPNTGGAGGFSRGLKEAMQQPEITHMLLMDDDVEVEFEAIYRTKSLLCYLKPDYEEHFIGGAMFRMDKPWMLHAAGESWNNGCIINPHKNMDMRTFEAVKQVAEQSKCYKSQLFHESVIKAERQSSNKSVFFANKQPFHKNTDLAGKKHFYQSTTEVYQQLYAAWWYCCIPRTHVEKKGYPLPLFLHCDDVEYGLRNGRAPIYLNGIAVWHEEFDDKRSSVMEYYDTRNRLITNALYMKKGKRRNAIYILTERFFSSILRYRYQDIWFITTAVYDYLKGPDWLWKLDSGVYHRYLLRKGYQMKPSKQQRVLSKIKQREKAEAVLRYVLPAHGKAVLEVGACVSSYAGKKEILVIDKKAKKELKLEKSWNKTVKSVWGMLQAGSRLWIDYKRVELAWKQAVEN